MYTQLAMLSFLNCLFLKISMIEKLVTLGVHPQTEDTPPWEHPRHTPLGRQPPWADTPCPHQDGHCSGPYASCSNAFLLEFNDCSQLGRLFFCPVVANVKPFVSIAHRKFTN